MAREGYEIYESYLKANKGKIERGEEVVLEVRDLQEFTRKVVRAKVAESPEILHDGKALWIRTAEKEELKPKPVVIKIIEELDEDTPLDRGELEEGRGLYRR